MLNDVGPIMTAIRNIFIIFDACIYYFVNFGFTMLFNIATFNLVDRKMIFDLVSRIQLIIGIFMLFQLAMTIIKGIVNPDSFTDSKSGGAGNVIMRIIVSLVLLALLVPLNISNPKNEYEKQINNNGVLFGTLYSLQYRILTNDTLGKLILGDDSTNYTSSDPDGKSLSDFGNSFTTTVIKAFYTLNVDDEGNYVCNDGWDEVYKSEQMTAHEIIVNGTRTCGDDNWPSWAKTLYDLTPYGAIDGAIHDEKYSISMSYITCTIVGIVLFVLLCMMIFNVATRVFKLVALQLLAPIPVISYMDPKGSKDSAFNSWLKLLGTTYLELFIQLGVIYFAISIIKSFMERFPELSLQTVVDTTSTGAIQGPIILRWTFIIMTIALFIFAKDAPKFFKQMLGIKTERSFFDSFGQALGVGAMAAGTVSSGIAGAVSKYESTSGNKGKKVGAAILGGLGGAAGGTVNAGRTFFKSKDGAAGSIMEGNRRYASQLYANAADESTPLGRFVAGAQSNFGLQNELQKLDNQMKYYNAASDALGRITKAFDGNGDYKFNVANDISDGQGNIIVHAGELKSLKDMNDLCNFYSSDGIASKALDSAKKKAQTVRFSQIRKMDREDIVTNINNGTMSTNDLVVYDSGKRIWDVAKKYIDEPEFARFKDPTTGEIRAYNDAGTFAADVLDGAGNVIISAGEEYLQFGYAFKHDAGQAGKTADQIKNSDKYAQAAANAKRAQEAGKKK